MSELYPEAIYGTRNGGTMTHKQRDGFGGMARRYAYNLGYADGRFKERLEASNPLAGWSNLTEAINAGERIDWDALDGMEAKCVHPELGTLTYKLERDEKYTIDSVIGWYKSDYNSTWSRGLGSAWCGHDGWSLWVKGDLPMRKLTADQLEPGTIFEAVLTDEEEFGPATLLRVDAGIIDTGDWQALDVDLTCIEVSRVLGTFQTPGEDA